MGTPQAYGMTDRSRQQFVFTPHNRPTMQVADHEIPEAPHRRVLRRRRLLVPITVDLIAAAVAATIGPWLAAGIGVPEIEHRWSFIFAGVAIFALGALGAYRQRLSGSIARGPRTYALAATIGAGAVILLQDLVHEIHNSLSLIVPWFVLVTILAAGRLGLDAAVRRGSVFVPGWRTLIVGAGGIGRVVGRRLAGQANLRLQPIGILDEGIDGYEVGDLPILGRIEDLERVVDETDAEHIIVAFPNASAIEQLDLIRRSEKLGLGVSIVPRLFTHVTGSSTVEHLGGVPLLTTDPPRPRSIAFAIKHAVDGVVSAGVLVILAPVMIAASVAILVTMGRPILFRQLRVGRDGRMFMMMKFRSMRRAEPGADDTARLTSVGRFLRASSIDELPQLINVLVGHMSLIGPRPEQPYLVETYEGTVDRYRERHRVRSGITGWAQVHGLGRGVGRYDLNEMAERVEWDNYYVENWSPFLDLRIVFLTVLALVRFKQR